MLSPELMLELLLQGDALAVPPQHLARRLAVAAPVRASDIDTPGLVMSVSVFTLANAPPSTVADAFRSCLVEAAALR